MLASVQQQQQQLQQQHNHSILCSLCIFIWYHGAVIYCGYRGCSVAADVLIWGHKMTSNHLPGLSPENRGARTKVKADFYGVSRPWQTKSNFNCPISDFNFPLFNFQPPVPRPLLIGTDSILRLFMSTARILMLLCLDAL